MKKFTVTENAYRQERAFANWEEALIKKANDELNAFNKAEKEADDRLWDQEYGYDPRTL